MKSIERVDLGSIQPGGPNGRFQKVKKRLRSVHCLLEKGDGFSDGQISSLIALILNSENFREDYKAIIGIDEAAEGEVPQQSRFTRGLSRLGDWLLLRDPSQAKKAYREFFDLSPLSDHDYLIFLRQLKVDQPAFAEVIDEILVMAHRHIANALSNALNGYLPSRLQHDMNEKERQELIAKCKQLEEEEEARSWGALKEQLIQDLEASSEQYARI